MGPVEKEIRERILKEFAPVHFELLNESANHSGPATESHFRAFIISKLFDGKTRLKRQQDMDTLLRDLLDGPIHAFSQRLLTPAEADKQGQMPESPNCRGSNKI